MDRMSRTWTGRPQGTEVTLQRPGFVRLLAGGRGHLVALGILLLLGLSIRFYDLTDAPLDFHETRQLGSAVVARGMYYQMLPGAPADRRDLAQQLWRAIPVYEPRFLERLVALTYLAVGDEYLWIARIYSALFWVLAAIGVYALARSATTSMGGLVAAGFYLISPYAIIASRSFQPDPLMTALVVFSLLAIYRWSENPSMRRAIVAGAVCGAAVLAKAVAAFPLLGALAATGWSARGFKRGLRDPQLWSMTVVAMLPSLVYYLILAGPGSAGLFSFWVLRLRDLLSEPYFYVRWVQQMEYVVGFGWLVGGLLGALLLGRVATPLLVGALGGYLIYGLALPFQIMTHDYYHLMLVPLVALGLGGLSRVALLQLAGEARLWRLAALGVAVFTVGYSLWEARVTLAADDYRLEAAGWRRLGEAMPRDGAMVALTHAYGSRLQYYAWINVGFWPGTADIELAAYAGGGEFDFEQEFATRTHGARYFLITNFAEFDRQPELKEHLYAKYAVYAEGEGFLIFDLRQAADLERIQSDG